MSKHSALSHSLPFFRVQCIEVKDRNWDGVQPEITTLIQSGEQAMEFIAQLEREFSIPHTSKDSDPKDLDRKRFIQDMDRALSCMMSGDTREGHIDSALVVCYSERWTFEMKIV